MEQLFKKNIKALEKNNYDLAKKIKKLDEKKIDFKLLKTKDESDIILELNIEGRSKKVNSIYNPYKEAKIKIDKLDLGYYNFIAVMGIGCGYYIEEILERFNKDSRMVIFENRLDILKEILKYRDLTNIFESHKVLIFDGTNDNYFVNMKKKIKNIVHMALLAGNVDFFELPVLKEKEKNEYKKFRHQFISLMHYQARVMGNSSKDSLIGVENIIKNLNYLLKSPSLDKIEHYKNKPAVCVAAGPSLDKNIDVLKKYQDKVLIIAVDTILEKLLDHGIEPDIVGVLERTEKVYEYFFKDLINNNKLSNDVTLIGLGVMDEKICNNFPGKIITTLRNTVNSENWFAENVNGVKGCDPGNSVANLNFTTAQLLGCSPIILVGQDLSFGSGKKQHASGTEYERRGEQEIKNSETFEVEGYYGGKIKTKKVWNQFKKWFEFKIAETNAFCIDATEGGAYIKGTKRWKLSKVAEKYFGEEQKSFNKVINVVKKKEFENRANKLKNAMERKIDIFEEIQDKTFLIKEWMEETLENLEKSENKYDLIAEVFYDMNRELVLLTRYDPFFYFIAQPIIIEMERNKVRMGKLERDNTVEKFIIWCKENIDNLKDIKKIIEELIEQFELGKEKVKNLTQ